MNRTSKDGYWFAIVIVHILSCNDFNLNFHSIMRQHCDELFDLKAIDAPLSSQ